jgi:hypothetical protein
MFHSLPAGLVEQMEEVAVPTEGYPFSEDGSITYLCNPMVTTTRKTHNFLTQQWQQYYAEFTDAKRPTHADYVEAALHFELDFWKDSRGNFYFN